MVAVSLQKNKDNNYTMIIYMYISVCVCVCVCVKLCFFERGSTLFLMELKEENWIFGFGGNWRELKLGFAEGGIGITEQ